MTHPLLRQFATDQERAANLGALDAWFNHVRLLERGEIVTSFAVLALGCTRMGLKMDPCATQARFLSAARAASTFARDWCALSGARGDRLEVLLSDATTAAWVLCPDCPGYFCRLHLAHVSGCGCPPLEDWQAGLNPYLGGGAPRLVS